MVALIEMRALMSSSSQYQSTNHHNGNTDAQSEAAGNNDTGGRKYHFSSYTGSERKKFAARWENAFYGKIHYDPGMRERYESAAEEEAAMDEAIRQRQQPSAKHHSSSSSDQNESGSNPPLPSGADDLTVDQLKDLPEGHVKHYIVSRLTRAERRIKFSVDYGSLYMMSHLNDGEMLLREAEELLTLFGWMNAALRVKIDELRDDAYKIKYDNDLD